MRCKTSHLALALALASPLAAQADLSNQGGGDYALTPLYRALVFGGIDQGGGGFDFPDIFGTDYASNTSPLPVGSATQTVARNGATLDMNGWAAWSGFYAARTFASISVSNANADDGYSVGGGQGSGTGVTFYSDEAASARATFTFHISGTESNPSNVGRATSRLDFAATADPDKTWNNLFFDDSPNPLATLSTFGAGTYTYTLPSVELGTPIKLFFWTSAFTEVLPGEAAQGSSFAMNANYGSTVVLVDVQLFDPGTDQRLANWTLEDDDTLETVFDNTGRLAAVLPAPVPEPGTWLMLAAGLGGLALARRRRDSLAR